MVVRVRSAKVLTRTVKNCVAISVVLMTRLVMMVAAVMVLLVQQVNVLRLVLLGN